ncbi:MAG: LacI family DNA-binding transcriptional regulator [Caldilineaceae bacterium]|nr:LacI family DNA-binding transcriptional regulator [Caldilineaceae bacterium]
MKPRTDAPRNRPVTMRDVAERADVSQSTVSRVLSPSESRIPISEATRQRVLEAVEALGYQPNLHAGSLRGQKTRMIAMMIADIGNPFYHPMVRAAQDIAAQYRYDVMIANSDHMAQHEQHFVESVIRRPVDGIFLVPYHLDDNDLDELIGRTGAALAVVGQHIHHPDVDVAFGNDERATKEIVAWLHRVKGHSRIGFIGVLADFSAAMRRRIAYEQAIQQTHAQARPEYKQFGDWSPESGYAAMQRLLELEPRPTAVFAINDLMAIGAVEAIQQQGLRVPEDIAVVGFDDIPAASWVRPQLSTVAQFPAEMSSLLVHALFERINGEYSGPGRRFEVPCRFVERQST